MIGRVIHILLSFFVSLLTARYLGPSNYGLINYAAAYATFFASFCTLGINSVIIKNFIDYPQEEGKTIGTAIILRLISSLLSIVTIIGIVTVIDNTEPLTITVVWLYCFGLLFQIFDTFNYWFQAKLMSKYYAFSTLIAYLIVSFYKLFLLYYGKDVRWFAVSNSIDYCIVAIVLYMFYRKCNGPKLSFSINKTKQLLKISSSYILPGLMVAVYAATDKLMLKQMLEASAVGYYSLAVSISGMWTFILSAIIDSLKPQIMKYSNTNFDKYILYNTGLYSIVFYTSFIASIIICLIAPFFINLVYGANYLPAVNPLRIVVWYVAFSYLGVARDTWIVCEGKQKNLKYIYIGSAIANVCLNCLFIPLFGANGAAIASLLTQISTIFLFPMFIKDMRPNIKLIINAILLKNFKLFVKEFKD